MNSFIGSVFWLLVTLGVLVTFHEYGHYVVARRCGVRVLRFSVGFGRALWKRIGRDGTEYQIAAIPLGGYVKMLDAREGEVDPKLAGEEFTGKPVWQRIAIVVAGPAFNLIFAVAAFWLMFVLGKPDVAPVVTAAPNSLAASAGIRPGDRLLSVGGVPVEGWTDVLDHLADGMLSRAPLAVTVRNPDGAQRALNLPLDRLPAGRGIDEYLTSLGLQSASPPAIAATVMPGQPASDAGMRSGDRILRVNGIAVADFQAFSKLLPAQAARAPKLAIDVQRDGRAIPLTVTAHLASLEGQPSKWVIGVGAPPPEQVLRHYGPLQALGASLSTTGDRIASMFHMIGTMLSGQASTRNLSGVIGIAQVANASASMGLPWFLDFLGLVSLSLAVLNLLPIPILDGGHLLYYLIELVKGSPLSERAMVAGQFVGLALLFTLMGLAFYNDIHRMLPS